MSLVSKEISGIDILDSGNLLQEEIFAYSSSKFFIRRNICDLLIYHPQQET